MQNESFWCSTQSKMLHPPHSFRQRSETQILKIVVKHTKYERGQVEWLFIQSTSEVIMIISVKWTEWP